jgi:hypothetical protein
MKVFLDIIAAINAIILFVQLIIFVLQLRVFRKQANISEKQNEISEKQNKIIKNQLLIDSRREHSGEIKNNVISNLKEEIRKMPYTEIEIPQFGDNAKNNSIIKIEDKFYLTKENFFEKVKSFSPFDYTQSTNADINNEENALYSDFLESHLGKYKDSFIEKFNSFLGYSNKYHDIIVDIQQKFKDTIENKCNDYR